jgi:excisionase family DNA binding protein
MLAQSNKAYQEAPRPVLTPGQAAQQLAVSVGTIYGLCAARKLHHFRVGRGRGTIRIPDASLAAYLASVSVGGEAAPESQP